MEFLYTKQFALMRVVWQVNNECRYGDINVDKQRYSALQSPLDGVKDLSGAQSFSER